MNYLISGASRGIGLELSLLALEKGHSVVALARDPFRSGGLNGARKTFPDQLEIVKCDVGQEEDLQSLASQLEGRRVDVLVNNAGMMAVTDESFKGLSRDDMWATFGVNTVAPFRLTQILLKNLLESTAPKLINITSQMGSIADNSSGGYYAYRMSKCALNMFTKAFALDYPKVIALALHPGWVRTEMGGGNAPVLPRESARGLMEVIEQAQIDQSGSFLNFKGEVLPF